MFTQSDAGCIQSDPPGALKEAEGGEVIGHFEEVGFGRSFVVDAEAVELHGQSVTADTNTALMI